MQCGKVWRNEHRVFTNCRKLSIPRADYLAPLSIYTSSYKLVPLFRKSSQRSSKEKPTPLEYTSQHKSTVVFFVKQKLPDHCLVIPNISKQYIVNSLLCISRSIFLYSILIKFMFDVCWQMTTRQLQFWKSRRGVKFTLMVDAASAGL